MGLASSGGSERVYRACSRQMRQRRAGRRSASGQSLKHHVQLLRRASVCVSMCMAGEARTHGAAHAWCVRDERALRACARVQSAEQRARAWQWRGEAKCATCLFVRLSFAPEQNAKRAYSHIRSLRPRRRLWRLLGAAAATATPVATLHVDGHGAETFYGRSKRKKEEQNDGSAGSSRRASGRQW